ncbi:IclR family transcriptional regulator [Neobacillus sp. Marseille-QA0830]
MDKKYWVPAIERAENILDIIANKPNQYRLIDLSNTLKINKSSLYSMLNTLETLGWIKKERDDTYSLGMRMGILGALYFSQFDLIGTFSTEAVTSVNKLNETFQLSVLDGTDILYIAKKEGTSPVRLATDPGMKFPAHATAMGKVHLSKYSVEQLQALYAGKELEPKTAQTVKTLQELWEQMTPLKENGYILEDQEAVEGFTCVAAPIRNVENEIIAAVSVTMPVSHFEMKQEQAKKEIVDLARRISHRAGYVTSAK